MGVQALRLTCAVLLLICWTSDPVNCQSVKIEGVSTNFFTISWPRVLQWFGVESFTITTQPEDSHSCQQTIPCKNDTCVYNSRGCSSIFPCTNTSIVVTGDNYSAPQLSLITDVIPLVASLNTTSKCTEVSVTWVYNDVCPDVAYITVYIERGEYYSTKNTSITSYVFQGLLIGTHYEVCVKAMAADLSTLGSHVCEYISTASDVVADLTLEALGSTELSANWLPPICPAGIGLYYEVQVEDETFFDYHYDENMQETNHTWSDLRYGNTYRPYLVKVEEISYTKLLVTWDFDTYQGDNSYDFKFNVTWGDSLENSAITQYYQYSIRGYNVSRENRRVCVRATQHDDFFSQNGCLGDPYVPTTQAPYPVIDGMSAGLIAFIVIGCLAAVFAIISIGSIAAI
ncbi:Receptor-type tyrosine-protein phosphatase eta-like 1, partial [Homarus americanus]